MDSDIKKKAIEFIGSQHIMTLATAEKEFPWSAPVYYIFYEGCFYFFSGRKSRHILEALASKKAAVSIHFQSAGWSDIRGVQMAGTVLPSGIGRQSAAAFNLYLKTFDFIGEIKKTVAEDIASVESAFNVTFYKFMPETVDYLDNRVKFGFKERVFL